jgi:hypothetical protein
MDRLANPPGLNLNFSIGTRFTEYLRRKSRAENISIATKLRIPNPEFINDEKMIQHIIESIYQNVQFKYKPKTPEKFSEICNGLLEKLNADSGNKSSGNPINSSLGLPGSGLPGGQHSLISDSNINPLSGAISNQLTRELSQPGTYISNLAAVQDPIKRLQLKAMEKCCCSTNQRKNLNEQTMITCVNPNCRKKYHRECMPWPEEEIYNFECPRCII